MDVELIERIKADMRYEFERTAPPEGFPAFHDIPTARHTSEQFWDLEQAHLWTDTWVIAGRVEDVPNPGDYFTFGDLGVPLLIVRGTDGEIRCFYNTCQHRGAPVVRDTHGSARRLRCQYHSWTYEVDGGTLVSVPDERDFVDLDWEQRCLPRASCDTFAGFVFVNRNLEAQPLREWIGAAAEMFEPFQGETLREVYRESRIIPCNWKVTAEAFLEVYHFRHIHSHDGVSVLDNRGAAMGLYPNGHSRMITPVLPPEHRARRHGRLGRLAPPRPGPVPTDRHSAADGRLHEHRGESVPERDHPARDDRIPDQPVLADRPAHHPPRLDLLRAARRRYRSVRRRRRFPSRGCKRRQVYNQIMAEDEMNMAPMQASMESPALTGIPINYQERRIWHLHEEIDRVIGAERIPAELRLEPVLAPYVERR